MMQKKNVWIIVVFIILGIVAFALAGGGDNANEKDVALYFFDKTGYAIAPMEVKIQAETGNELYGKVAEALISGPNDKKYLPIMDRGVTVREISVFGENLAVDFSEEYPQDNLMCTYAVIKTFSRLPGVHAVRVTQNGEPIVGSDGLGLGFVTGDEINTESDEDTATGVSLFFANSAKNDLVVEYRKINIVDTSPIEQYVVSELIKGPKVKGNERLLASDTKVLSVETTDGICYVNFKKGFLEKNVSLGNISRLVIDSVVKSLTSLNNVNGVQFLVEGKKTDKFGDTDISGLFLKEQSQENVIAR